MTEHPKQHRHEPSPAPGPHPYVELAFERLDAATSAARSRELYAELDRRRSVRDFAPDPVPREWIELAIRVAGTAPSGAHKQPWTFVAVGDPALKRAIRAAAEAEEKKSYEERMSPEWLADLAPLGTDWHKPFLEIAPWLVVVFAQVWGEGEAGARRHHYYVKESVGIACGLFIAAIHHMGLVTLPHTPSPMEFLARLLERPPGERAYVLFPVGYPAPGARVPDLARKPLAEIAVFREG